MDAITQSETAVHMTDGQRKMITRFACDAIEGTVARLDMTRQNAQFIIEHGDAFVSKVRKAVTNALNELSSGEVYTDEEIPSSFTYSGTYRPRQLAEQCTELEYFFPHATLCKLHEMALKLPNHAEAWFAIPQWQSVASTYTEAVDLVLNLLKERYHGFVNHRASTAPLPLREGPMKLRGLDHVIRAGDVLLFPAQFGMRHRGRSARRALKLMLPSEFPLGVYEVGIMLLLHPQRLVSGSDLWIDCAGDIYSAPEFTDDLAGTSYFFSTRGALEYGAHENCEVRRNCGVATGFLVNP